MRWSERQRAMLAEMGLRPWFRDSDDTVTADEPIERRAVETAPPEGTDVIAIQQPAAIEGATQTTTEPRTDNTTDRAATIDTEAGWLIVGGPSEPLDPAARAAIEAEQDLLLANMLRAIGVSPQADAAGARAVHVRVGAADSLDLDRLHAQTRPRGVIVLGRAAALALLGIDEPLGRLRGRVHTWRGVPAVVTFPLAYLLRNPGEKAKAWLDLCLAVAAVDPPTP